VIASSAILVPSSLVNLRLRPSHGLSEVRQLQLGLNVRRSVPGKRTMRVKRLWQVRVTKIIRLANTVMPKS